MALDFPTSPTDGQIYDNYYWDNTNSVWRLLGDSLEVAADFSNTATGTYTDGFDYKYVSFTSDGTLTVTRGGYADLLLVGGGGAGGKARGGGGGAGGVLYIENAYIPAGSLDVVVGDGATLNPSSWSVEMGAPGQNGEASSLWKYYAVGGGSGAGIAYRQGTSAGYAYAGLNGGSGGGACGPTDGTFSLPGGSGTPNQGNNGGAGDYLGAGGGGGAGAVGGDAPSSNTGGDGGDGISNSITGSAVTYGGGGGGAGSTSGSGGAGGGGAAGTTGVAGTDGLGGGGGGNASATSGIGGNGGSGIVIVRVRTN